jgi:hypothetical protein
MSFLSCCLQGLLFVFVLGTLTVVCLPYISLGLSCWRLTQRLESIGFHFCQILELYRHYFNTFFTPFLLSFWDSMTWILVFLLLTSGSFSCTIYEVMDLFLFFSILLLSPSTEFLDYCIFQLESIISFLEFSNFSLISSMFLIAHWSIFIISALKSSSFIYFLHLCYLGTGICWLCFLIKDLPVSCYHNRPPTETWTFGDIMSWDSEF